MSSINRKQLCEIGALRNPPKGVAMTISAVMALFKDIDRANHNRIKKENEIKIDLLFNGYINAIAREINISYPIEMVREITQWIDPYSIKIQDGNSLSMKYWLTRLPNKHRRIDWKTARKFMHRNDFIPSILKFDSNKIKEKTRKQIEKTYLSQDGMNFERVNKASKVAGPFLLWVKAQIKFTHLLDCVEPMTKEIKELKLRLEKKQKQADELRNMADKLEQKIGEYKDEYSRMTGNIIDVNGKYDTT